MFERPGDSLQLVSKILFMVSIICMAVVYSILLVLVLIGEYDILSFLGMIIVGGISIFGLYVQFLMFCCLGKLTESAQNIEYKLSNQKPAPNVYVPVSGSVGAEKPAGNQPVKMQAVNPVAYYKKQPVAANQWQCKKCGKVLADYVGSCGCGNTRRENDAL